MNYDISNAVKRIPHQTMGIVMSGKSFSPNEIDIRIGHIISTLRHKHGLSQKDLGKVLGVTFQQIQKYENASCRVSAASLYIILKTLEEPFSAVFTELGDAELYDAPLRRAIDMLCKLGLYDRKIVYDLIERLGMSSQCVSRIRRKPIKRSLMMDKETVRKGGVKCQN